MTRPMKIGLALGGFAAVLVGAGIYEHKKAKAAAPASNTNTSTTQPATGSNPPDPNYSSG